MPLRNDSTRFGHLAQAFHWLTFLLLIGSFSIAYSMVDLPLSPEMLKLYSWHKWVGATVFLVVILRLGWRLIDGVPAPPGTVGPRLHLLATLSHGTLYTILIVMPITGWIMSSALNLPLVYLGLFHIPSPFGVDEELGETLKIVHRGLSIALLVMVSIHVLAALYHHLILRDDVLRRMVPGMSRRNRVPNC